MRVREAGQGISALRRVLVRPELVLVLVTFVWGSTFFVTQVMLRDTGPFAILAVRFTVGAAALALMFRRRLSGLTRGEVRTGAVIGVVTFASYALQTAGLQHVTSSRSAFITSMYVPVVPLLQLVLLRQMPRWAAWLGISVSFAGLLMLSAGQGAAVAMGTGEWLTLAGAVMAALQIVLLSRWAAAADPMRLALVQLCTVAAAAMLAMPLEGEGLPPLTAGVVGGGLGLGLLGTAFALGAMTWAQQTVAATRATVIYSMEPVWGGVIGALAGEAMTRSTVGGSVLIVAGVLISELRWRPARRTAVEAMPELGIEPVEAGRAAA
jgi:drug/metabolite transporter (DMT)-like permease